MPYSFSTFWFTIVSLCLIFSCKSSESIAERQNKLPPSRTTEVPYTSDEKIKSEIVELEKKRAKAPDDEDNLLKLAAAYLDIQDKSNAKIILEELVALASSEAKVYSSLAQIYKSELHINGAIKMMETYIAIAASNDRPTEKAELEMVDLRAMKSILSKTYSITIEALPSPINTQDLEYLPQFTIDQKSLVFTRRLFGQEDLFEAYNQNDGRLSVRAIDELNTPQNEGAHSLSADGEELYFTQCQGKYGYGKCDLYVSTKEDEKWSQPKNLGATVNSENWESQPSISANGKVLYFSSDRPGSVGGTDIWYCLRTEEGKWSNPINAGLIINTVGNEGAPFIHADGQTLYFQSSGHPGLGQQDLFFSTIVNSNWTTPQNLGFPINSSANEGALVVSLDGLNGYYATDQINNVAINQLDIVKFNLPEDLRPRAMTYVKGRVIATDSNFPLMADIEIESLTTGKGLYKTKANSNGEFLAAVPVGESIAINISQPGYVFYSDHVEYDEVRYGVEPYLINARLESIKEDITEATEPIILKNIFFETGSAKLLENSNLEITYLVNLLNDYPSKKIEVIGHTDDVGSDQDNLALSQARAESVRQAMIKNGIDANRITAIGKGESMPIADNTTSEGRAINRRTEFILK